MDGQQESILGRSFLEATQYLIVITLVPYSDRRKDNLYSCLTEIKFLLPASCKQDEEEGKYDEFM